MKPVPNQFPATDPTAFWHRVADTTYAGMYDEFGYNESSTLRVEHFTYRVLRETRCGVWLDYGCGKGRFVKRASKRQFASPTFEMAVEKFKRRKQFQISMLEQQLETARRALALADFVKPNNHATSSQSIS